MEALDCAVSGAAIIAVSIFRIRLARLCVARLLMLTFELIDERAQVRTIAGSQRYKPAPI
jgi:hypothetical protein